MIKDNALRANPFKKNGKKCCLENNYFSENYLAIGQIKYLLYGFHGVTEN